MLRAGLAKMGLVDPSLRKREHGPKAVAKKAQRFYNSVVHGVADKKVEQQETSNMTQYCVSVLYATVVTRLRRPMPGVVSFFILSLWKTSGPSRRVGAYAFMKTASSRPHARRRVTYSSTDDPGRVLRLPQQ